MPNLTNQDKTRFLERGFTVVENAGHSLRLIKRDDARQAISIKWEDLSALRELITLALDDGPMVIGLDVSGQSAKNAATAMRDKCVEKVEEMRAVVIKRNRDRDESNRLDAYRINLLDNVIAQLQSLTLDQVKPGEM